MIKDKMQKAMNEQIKHEMESAYLYLSMAAWFGSEGLEGMAKWMQAQAAEEQAHAMKFFHHIEERGGRVELDGLSKPKAEWKSPLEVFTEADKHEQLTSGEINGLMELAIAEKDHAAKSLLQWFVDEQVEEEASTSSIVQKLERAGSAGHALLMMDRMLGDRE